MFTVQWNCPRNANYWGFMFSDTVTAYDVAVALKPFTLPHPAAMAAAHGPAK